MARVYGQIGTSQVTGGGVLSQPVPGKGPMSAAEGTSTQAQHTAPVHEDILQRQSFPAGLWIAALFNLWTPECLGLVTPNCPFKA